MPKRQFYTALAGCAFSLFCSTIATAGNSNFPHVQNALQQQQTVKGKVTDELGPVIGATITVKGNTTGTITDADGNFSINAPKGATLIISYLGYITQEVPVTGRPLNITLMEDTKQLNEVVVVGFATVKKQNLTGAVSAIDSKILEDRPLVNLGQGLQGAIPNLNISTSGRPGEGASYNVRGTTSLTGGGPLILVDGVEMDPNLINPQDVQSVSVLKDAASASIYGSRAAYGVILITTKNGRKNQPVTVSVDASLSFNGPTTRPKYMNSFEYANYMNAAQQTMSGRDYFDKTQMEHILAYYKDPVNNLPVYEDPSNPESAGGTKYIYCGNTDWMEEMYKRSYPVQNYNVNINGGSEKATYYTSAGFMDQGSLIKYGNEGFKKYNIMNNISYDIKSWLNISLRTSFNRTESDGLMQASALGNVFLGSDTRPIMPVRHPDGNFSGQGNFTNYPGLLSEGGSRETNKDDFWNTVTVKASPLKGLSLNMDYTFNYYNEINKFHTKEYMQYGVDGKPLEIFPWTKPNGAYQNQSGATYNALNLFADYELTLDKHYFKGLIGFNQESKHSKGFFAQRNNLIVNNLPSMSYATGERSVGNSDDAWATRSGFFRVNYNFDERYLIEVNGRYDLSSKFPKHDRAAFNPSFSAAWRLSNESWFTNSTNRFFDELKIRGSYGSLGNQALDSGWYAYLSNYGTGTSSWLMGGNTPQFVTPGGLVSSSITWEKVTQWDLGLDFSILDNRLKGAFDYYQRQTSDILMKGKTLPSIIGTSEPQTNAAELKTKGWEGEISWNDRLSNGLIYSVGFNISDYKATVTNYDNPTKDLNQSYYIGQRIGEIWGYETAGLFQSQEEINNWADQKKLTGLQPVEGDLKFADLNGDNVIDWGNNTVDNSGDKKIIGNSTPRYQYGIRASAEWKGIDLSMFFQGVGKRDINMPSTFFLSHYSNEWRTPSQINTDYWSEDNRDAFFPRPRFNNGGVSQSQTRFLQDASYLRLKSLVIGYTLPQPILSKIGIERLRFYVSGENLFTIKQTPDGFDPEVLDALKYPLQKCFAFGLNVTF